MSGARARHRAPRSFRGKAGVRQPQAKDSRGLAAALQYAPRVLPYLHPYHRLMGLAVLLMVSSAAVSLAAPWPLAFLVDNALGSRRPPEIVTRLTGTTPWRLILFAVLLGLFLTV